jgi:hypothetical protein
MYVPLEARICKVLTVPQLNPDLAKWTSLIGAIRITLLSGAHIDPWLSRRITTVDINKSRLQA